jgi:septin family protein
MPPNMIKKKENSEEAEAEQRRADRYAEAQRLRLERVNLQDQRVRERRKEIAEFREEWTAKARDVIYTFPRYSHLLPTQRSACVRAAIAEVERHDPIDATCMESVLQSLIDTTAAPFLEEYETRKLRARVKHQMALTVDWQERSLAAEAIHQAFAATPLGASEAELRAAANGAIQPAIQKREQRIEAKAAARKKAEANQRKEGQRKRVPNRLRR